MARAYPFIPGSACSQRTSIAQVQELARSKRVWIVRHRLELLGTGVVQPLRFSAEVSKDLCGWPDGNEHPHQIPREQDSLRGNAISRGLSKKRRLPIWRPSNTRAVLFDPPCLHYLVFSKPLCDLRGLFTVAGAGSRLASRQQPKRTVHPNPKESVFD